MAETNQEAIDLRAAVIGEPGRAADRRVFGRWVPVAAIIVAATATLLYHRSRLHTYELPHKPPNPALLAKFPAMAVGWDNRPLWFLGKGGRHHRSEVDYSTGIFIHNQTDLFIGDTIPIVLSRTYMSTDQIVFAFGIGAGHWFDIYLSGDNQPFTFITLILFDGAQVYFHRITPGVGFSDAIYRHDPEPGEAKSIYSGATMRWDIDRWDLRLADGTMLNFPGSRWATRQAQAALIAISTPAGDLMTIQRDALGNVLKVTSPNGAWMTLTHDAANRVTSAHDSVGHTVAYRYDAKGRLVTVKDAAGGITRYTYDDRNLMLSIIKPDGSNWIENKYDSGGRLAESTLYGKTTKYSYTLGSRKQVVGTDVTGPDGVVDHFDFDSNGIEVGHSTNAPQGSKAPAKAL